MTELRLEHAAGVATITLVDPGGVNVLGPDLMARLRGMLTEVDRDPAVAAIVLRAEADAFSAGGDITWFADLGDACHDGINGLAEDSAEAIRLLHETSKITIAAVHGAIAGGGLGLALACDLVVAARGSTIALAYARIGASPDLGVSAFLVRDLGYRRALELYLRNATLDADTAHELGLYTAVVAPDELDDATAELAALVARGPREAHATAKRLLRTAAARPLKDHLGDELRSVADLSRGADWHEGITAFLAHRSPRFGAPAG